MTLTRRTLLGVSAGLMLGGHVFAHKAKADSDIARLVDHVINAYGGRANLERVGNLRQTGVIVSLARQGAEGRFQRLFVRPNRLRMAISYGNESTELRIFDGLHSWSNGRQSSQPQHEALVLQAARLALPLLLLERVNDLKDIGATPGPEGSNLNVLELNLAGGLSLSVEIEPRSGRILRSKGLGQATGSMRLDFGTAYSDFRMWNGVLMAMREDQYALGQYIGHVEITAVDSPAQIPADIFRP